MPERSKNVKYFSDEEGLQNHAYFFLKCNLIVGLIVYFRKDDFLALFESSHQPKIKRPGSTPSKVKKPGASSVKTAWEQQVRILGCHNIYVCALYWHHTYLGYTTPIFCIIGQLLIVTLWCWYIYPRSNVAVYENTACAKYVSVYFHKLASWHDFQQSFFCVNMWTIIS